MEKSTFVMIYDDHGDTPSAELDDDLVEVNAGYSDDIGGAVLLYFDRSHIPQFQELIRLLEQTPCKHEKTIHINIQGTDERISVCEDCNQEV